MQNQPTYRYEYSHIGLDRDFPFTVSPLFTQHDRPITHLHSHNVIEFGLCLEGHGVFVVDQKILAFQEGDVSVISGQEMHLAQSARGTVSNWYWVYVDIETLLFATYHNSRLADTARLSGRGFCNIISGTEFPIVRERLGEIIRLYHDKPDFYRERITSLLCLLIADLHAMVPNSLTENNQRHFDSDTLQRLQRAVVHMTEHYEAKCSVTALAEMCSLSVTHFRRLFQQTFGKSPRDYLNEIRITMAQAALAKSRQPINEVALESGFPTLSSFNRQFKKQTGTSPRQWRERKSQKG